jgi:tRNA(fMet)-specific endonuclease VapC
MASPRALNGNHGASYAWGTAAIGWPRRTHLSQPRWLERIRIVPCDAQLADRWGTLRARLRERGKLPSDVDLLIAARAAQAGAVLVTDDRALLAGDIPGLTVENWT